MEKTMAKTDEAAVEKEKSESADTAKLKGDNIKVKYDFSDLAKLTDSPLTLVDKHGIDVRLSMTDYHFAWFTDEDADKWTMYGFAPVNDVFGKDVRAPIQSKKKREDAGGQIKYRDAIAYVIPQARYQEYLDFVQKENVIDTDGLVDVAEGEFRKHGGQYREAVVSNPDGGIREMKIDSGG